MFVCLQPVIALLGTTVRSAIGRQRLTSGNDSSPGPAAAAIAVLADATALTARERRLLEEWLDRLAASTPT
jgi:hypothetical protein